MRSVSYVERVALDFTGNLFTQAICLGDTDNDGLNELVVGDTNGKLYVYKNDDCKPWITRSCIGMVTCVGVGDICNKGKNFVVAVGAEGWFHIFDLSGISTKSDTSSHHDCLFSDEQKALYTQHIPANTKVMLISDIDGDGKCEMVVGYTDRVVRAFRWEDSLIDSSGQLILLKKWLLEGQVDSLTVNPGSDGSPELMVSQPGCAYAVLLCTWKLDQEKAPKRNPSGASNSEGLIRDVILHQTSGRIHNKNVSTHLIGSINRGCCDDASKSGLFALCTLDGTLKLMDGSDKLLWSVQVDHQLFALEKLDVTGDGREEVVACAWDGQTYIIDQNRSVVRFQFDENVSAFCAVGKVQPPDLPDMKGNFGARVTALHCLEPNGHSDHITGLQGTESQANSTSTSDLGMYACKDGRNSPCLVYVSFNHKIYVYWKVELERMESTNILKVLEADEFRNLLQATSVDASNNSAVQAMLHQTLYFPDQLDDINSRRINSRKNDELELYNEP